MRADLAMCETYEYRDEPPFTCPIYVHGGEHDDKVPLERVTPWRVYQGAVSFLGMMGQA